MNKVQIHYYSETQQRLLPYGHAWEAGTDGGDSLELGVNIHIADNPDIIFLLLVFVPTTDLTEALS